MTVPPDSGPHSPAPLDPQDAKIVTLARTARLRAYPRPGRGAAARDETGRTYAAATFDGGGAGVVTALAGALSAAISSGARAFEAFAVVDEVPALSAADRDLLAVLAAGCPVLLATPDGTVVATETI